MAFYPFKKASLVALSLSLFVMRANAQNSIASTRFDDLVIWKLTDELKLNADQEKRFNETLRSLNIRKKSANDHLADALIDLKNNLENKSPKKISTALAKYRSALSSTQKIQIAELEELQKVLGQKKLAEYLVSKNEVLSRLTEALLNSETTTSTAGGAPLVGASPSPAASASKPAAALHSPLPSPGSIEDK
jgi:hypothetical protein